MDTYTVKVIDIDVHAWGKDGEGDYICTKGGFDLDTCSSIEKAIDAIENYIGYDLDTDSLSSDGEYIDANIIENRDGYPDRNGEYIADYTFSIERNTKLNLGNYIK